MAVAKRKQNEEEESSSENLDEFKFVVVPCSEEEKLQSAIKLGNLMDELLIEVLLRLPSPESAIRAALVCKRWHSLIFKHSAYFASRFVSQHINHQNNYYYYQNSSSIVFISKNTDPRLCSLSEGDDMGHVEVYSNPYIDLDDIQIPYVEEEASCNNILDVQASCDDLLYCRLANTNCYYLCNPYTTQSLPLPPPPLRTCYQMGLSHDSFAGLVCEPNFRRCRQGQQYYYEHLYHPSPRFRVVRVFLETENRFFVDTYCSETRKWNESLILDEIKCQRFHSRSNVVAYDGKLHWYDGTHVVAYDPFNINDVGYDDTVIFQPPVLSAEPFRLDLNSSCLGICQGLLRFMLLAIDVSCPTNHHMSVWELEDYETKRFSLIRKIYFNTFICKEPRIATCFRRRHPALLRARAIAFHPDNKDLLFLGSSLCDFIRCKIRSGELQLIGKSPYQDIFFHSEKAFQLLRPWWPTQVSTDALTRHSSTTNTGA